MKAKIKNQITINSVQAIFLLFSFSAFAQQMNLEFSTLRQNDNISSLIQLKNKDLYQKIKIMNVGKNGFLVFGGSIRFQSEHFVNEHFQNIKNQDNSWSLNRVMFHYHLKLDRKLEVFLELNKSSVNNKLEVSPVDNDKLSVNQFFLKYKWNKNWHFQIGRENLKLGSGRLIDYREGPNVRRSYDMMHINYKSNNIESIAFIASVPQLKPGFFDNDFLNFNEIISGIYSTINFSKFNNLDAYLLYQNSSKNNSKNEIVVERRGSIGFRHFGKTNTVTFNNEAVFQFGSFGTENISAWTMSFQLEKNTWFFNKPLNFGLKSDIISGDQNPDDNKLNTFDAFYPRSAYFGRVARFGPSNIIDIHPYITSKINKWSFEIDYAAFWRYSKNDGVYNASLGLEYSDSNDQKFIANQLGAIIGYNINNQINFELDSNIILPGSFLVDKGLNNNLYHLVLTAEIKF